MSSTDTTRDVLVQAFLDAPVFQTRWRWNTTISLAVPRSRGGRKIAPQLQRMLADDLMAAVFPDAAACLENIPGDREIPDHPLVNQTVRDCLEEAMDFDGLAAVLRRVHAGELRLVARDTPEPSFFAHEILNAKPYAFLDDAPLEERRAHAVQARRTGDPAASGDLGALDPAAIARVRDDARPDPRDADELHDALLTAGFLTAADVSSLAPALFEPLRSMRRATVVSVALSVEGGAEPEGVDQAESPTPNATFNAWVAAERLPELLAVHPTAAFDARIAAPPTRTARTWTRDDAVLELLRGRLTMLGPVTAREVGDSLAVSEAVADAALLALESERLVLRGWFSPGARALEWCDRALLERIHRYTLHKLRAEIAPVSPADLMRFLFRWQHVDVSSRVSGPDGLREVVGQLGGFELAAGAWE
ncbi:MAG: ATP-dependent DNA helicase, partial [Acidobacteria bacterium]|nr:ATP-dependent DNA helicase [Acidobacteriota bacterium]